MHISSTNLTGTNLTGANLSAAERVANDNSARTRPPVADIPVGGSDYTPSNELQRLQDALDQTPPTRADRVRDVAQRLAAGFYATPAAAEQTAAVLLNARD